MYLFFGHNTEQGASSDNSNLEEDGSRRTPCCRHVPLQWCLPPQAWEEQNPSVLRERERAWRGTPCWEWGRHQNGGEALKEIGLSAWKGLNHRLIQVGTSYRGLCLGYPVLLPLWLMAHTEREGTDTGETVLQGTAATAKIMFVEGSTPWSTLLQRLGEQYK